MSTLSDVIPDIERNVCETCGHSFLWHAPVDPDLAHGCTVIGCHCDLLPKEEQRTVSEVTMRRFTLVRDEDVSGVSGTGQVAEGVLFSSGVVVLQWTSDFPTSVVFHERGVESLLAIHGHNGRTHIDWIDP